jgi:tetratricopeptide (TPR) repeat protein
VTPPDPAEIPAALAEARRLAQARRWADLARLAERLGLVGGRAPGVETGMTSGDVEPAGVVAEPAPKTPATTAPGAGSIEAGTVGGRAAAHPPELEYLLADALRRVGRNREALALALRVEDGAARIADRGLLLRCINLLGMIDFEAGSLPAAAARFDQLLERAASGSDDEFVARASNNLGVIANVRGERELAMTYYQRALAAYHRLGHTRGLAQTSYNLGISYRDLGFPEEAEQHYVKAIRYAELGSSEDVAALAETERAYLRAVAGDGQLAESLAARALERHRSMEDPGGSANATRVLAKAAVARGDFPLAMQRFDAALSIVETCDDPLLRAEIQLERGQVLHQRGDAEQARSAISESLRTFAALGAVHDARAAQAIFQSLFPNALPEQPPAN